MSLRDRYLEALEALEAAEKRSRRRGAAGLGESEIVTLQRGAAFRVEVHGTRVRVELRREFKPVGEVEEVTFKKHFQIPDRAKRADLPRDLSWWRVQYTWDRAEDPPAVEVDQATLF